LLQYAELAALFFLQAMATSTWFVPLATVLKAHGLQEITFYAFATTAAGALLSPLFFGAMADRHTSPVKVMRWLALASAGAISILSLAIQRGWNPWLVLALVQLHAICFAPTSSIVVTIVFAALRDSQKEFGPVRAMATFGWMCGCWLVSTLKADTSVLAGYVDAVVWLALAAFTFVLPAIPPPIVPGRLTLRQRLGWDAVELMKNHDHRVVFITVGLFYIPLSAFYPATPVQLQQLGLKSTTAWMTLGQMSEMIAMFSLAALLARWRLKWIFAVGLSVGILRFALCALNTRLSVLAGISLHGFSLVMVLITAQVYVDQRVDPTWRARAQALINLLTNGAGCLLGYLGVGWWRNDCTRGDVTQWPLFWGGLSATIGAVLVYFLTAYRGRGAGNQSVQ
jgi:MFS family permease